MFNIFRKKAQVEENQQDNAQTSVITEEAQVKEETVVEQPQEEVITEQAPQEQQEESVAEEPTEEKKNIWGLSFSGLKEVVSKTNEFLSQDVLALGNNYEEIDDDLLDDMEEKLIRADLGVETTCYLVDKLRDNSKKYKPTQIADYLKDEFADIIKSTGSPQINLKENQLNTFLVTGVNGAGKTTLIGKLANRYRTQGKKVLIAAGDTFRAAAEDQLEIWANRAGVDIVRRDGADPASVVFDAIHKAKADNYDILLIDTAGRLHNKFNLMEELRKIKKIIDKEAGDSINESMLVIDATTGQNGLKQAEVFQECVDLTAVGLTKLDGSSKGGIVAGIAKELNLPIKLIGVGEKIEDLKDFNSDDFVEALFS